MLNVCYRKGGKEGDRKNEGMDGWMDGLGQKDGIEGKKEVCDIWVGKTEWEMFAFNLDLFSCVTLTLALVFTPVKKKKKVGDDNNHFMCFEN